MILVFPDCHVWGGHGDVFPMFFFPKDDCGNKGFQEAGKVDKDSLQG